MECPYKVLPSPGKGLGAFATRDIGVGELIFSEEPLISARHMLEIPYLVDTLSEADREKFFSLVDHHPHPSPHGIFYNNAFDLGSIDGSWICAVFYQISRFNHSCSPNCSHPYIQSTGKMHIFANQYIPKGNELFVTYANLTDTQEKRIHYILDTFGFICDCPLCSTPSKLSDQRRLQIGSFYNTLEKKQLDLAINEPKDYYEFSKYILRLLDREMPHNYIIKQDAQHAAAMACLRVGNHSQATTHYGLAYAHTLIDAGSESSEHHNLLLNFLDTRKRPSLSRIKPLTKETITTHCDECGELDPKFNCPMCGFTQYCDETCYKEHQIHTPACKVLAPFQSVDW